MDSTDALTYEPLLLKRGKLRLANDVSYIIIELVILRVITIMKGCLVIITMLLAVIALLSNPTPVIAVQVNQGPAIDGILSDSIWDHSVPHSQSFIQDRPFCGKVMSESTEIMVVYDSTNLYIGLRMHDSYPAAFTRMVAPRDSEFSSEWIGVMLDTFNDDRNLYYFFLNVDNVQQDGRFCQVGGLDSNWDGLWVSATSTSDSGWTAEMSIPFSNLRYANEDVQLWGVNFKRTITRTSESGYLYQMADNGDILIDNFGDLEGLRELPSSHTLSVTPYGATRLHSQTGSDSQTMQWDYWASYGIDARVGLSSELNLDLTANPDYGQVESDPNQANLSHWETYLPEKRLFFLEGSDMFRMPFSQFYSRRIGAVTSNNQIVPILGGCKLTGTLAGLRIGLLEACTGRVEEEGVLYARLTNYTAGRVVKEFGEGSFLGVSGTSVDVPASDENGYVYSRSGSVDMDVSFLEHHTTSAALGATWNSSATEWDRNLAYRASYFYRDGRYAAECGIAMKEECFNANMIGYTSTTGDANSWLNLSLHLPRADGSLVDHARFMINSWYDKVPNGDVTSQGVDISSGIVFRSMYGIGTKLGFHGSHTDRYEGPEGTVYYGAPEFNIDCFSDSRDDVFAHIWLGVEPYCDGDAKYVRTSITWKPAVNLFIESQFEWNVTDDARKYHWSLEEWSNQNTDWQSLCISSKWMISNELSLGLSSQCSRFEEKWQDDSIYTSLDFWISILFSWEFQPGSMLYFLIGEDNTTDPLLGAPIDPEFTMYSKLTWALPI